MHPSSPAHDEGSVTVAGLRHSGALLRTIAPTTVHERTDEQTPTTDDEPLRLLIAGRRPSDPFFPYSTAGASSGSAGCLSVLAIREVLSSRSSLLLAGVGVIRPPATTVVHERARLAPRTVGPAPLSAMTACDTA
jgi:hypothetical protein